MIFKRRNPLTIWQRLRALVYPQGGWRRGFEYLGHRVRRLPDTPHRVALGLACGVFVSFSPFFGVHFFYAMLIAWLLGGNMVASLIGTFVGNPLTFPLIAWSSLGIGRWIVGVVNQESEFEAVARAFGDAARGAWQSVRSLFGYGEGAWTRLSDFFWDVFFPYYVGGLIPGLIAAVVMYYLARPLIAAYQKRRRNKLMERARLAMKRRSQTLRQAAARVSGPKPDRAT
ncbi:MAG: DUF2062 domain-containing protein [Pseudomonadota bacterium]